MVNDRKGKGVSVGRRFFSSLLQIKEYSGGRKGLCVNTIFDKIPSLTVF